MPGGRFSPVEICLCGEVAPMRAHFPLLLRLLFTCFAFQEWARTRCSAHGQNSLKRLQAPGEYGPATLRCSAPRTAPGTSRACANSADSVNLETSRVWIALSRCPCTWPLPVGTCGHMVSTVFRAGRACHGCFRATARTADDAPMCGIRKQARRCTQSSVSGGLWARETTCSKTQTDGKVRLFLHVFVNRKVEGTVF